MELFIQIRNGVPFEHPILGENLRLAFPDVDTENLPGAFARFVRVQPPTPGVYEVYEGVTYDWQGGVVTDVHHVRPMTAEEVLQKQDAVKAEWAENGFASWVFDEETCTYNPPVPFPDDGGVYVWNEDFTSWVTPSFTPTS